MKPKPNTTFLFPFVGNRINPGLRDRTIHMLKVEEVRGTRTWCGTLVTIGRTQYNQRDSVPMSEIGRLHQECLDAYYASTEEERAKLAAGPR